MATTKVTTDLVGQVVQPARNHRDRWMFDDKSEIPEGVVRAVWVDDESLWFAVENDAGQLREMRAVHVAVVMDNRNRPLRRK